MSIFGKRLSDYFAFSKHFLALILIVGVARFALHAAGAPNSIARWVSITIVMWIGVLYFSIRVHTSGFGSYKHLLPICYLQSLTAQLVIVPAIILAIFTGQDNIYSIPENFFGADGKTWLHVVGHLFIGGLTLGPLLSWLAGCLIMFAAKKTGSKDKGAKAVARA